MSIVLKVPTVNDTLDNFDYLFQLWQQVNSDCSEVTFDFSECFFLRQNAVAFLGGLVRLIEFSGGNVTFDWHTLRKHISMNLRQNGFMYAFNSGEEPWEGNSIPYREERNRDRDGLVYYLTEQWLGRDWVHVGQNLRNLIVSTVWEIYANAFEHAQSHIGVFSCGQYYPKLKELVLTVVDFGVGIPCNVRCFLKNNSLPADEALKWAFQPGTTTRRGSITGGIGLDYLKSFVTLNRGKLEIFSHDGYVMIDEVQETYQNRQTFFGGTLVNITLKCDESYYSLDLLDLESDDEPLF